MDYLQRHNYTVIPLSQLVQSCHEQKKLPDKAIVITFDDGTACIYEHAMPILEKYSFPATVFVISGLLGKHNKWLTDIGFPLRPMLNIKEIQSLDDGIIKVGSHTVLHPWLGNIPLDLAQAEIKDSKACLEDILGHAVPYFAYPFGNYSLEVQKIVIEAEYTAACSTYWGKNYTNADLFALKRVEIRGDDSLFQFALKLHTCTHNMPPIAEARQLMRRGLEHLGLLGKRV